jgi:neutral ceramidase
VSGADTHYIVTAEEYEAQRYEAASTLFGKHTLAAYILKFTELVPRFPWSPSST